MYYTPTQYDPVLRYPYTCKQTGLSESTIRRLIKEGDFPSPIPLGKRSVGFLASEIEDWKAKRVETARMAKEA